MRPEHTVETHVVSKLGTHLNHWNSPKTIRTFGNDNNNNALFSLQTNAAGQGRVVFNPKIIGLSVEEFKEAFLTLPQHEKNRVRNNYEDHFKSESVYFKNSPSDKSKNMVFSDFLDSKTFSQGNIWQGNSGLAVFINEEKASAFMEFMERNLPKVVAHFYNELGEVSQKIAQVVSLPQHINVPPVEQALNNFSNKQKEDFSSKRSLDTNKPSF